MSSPEERNLRNLRVGGLSAIGFFMMMGYSMARPAVESVFLAKHGHQGLPYAYLSVVGLMAASVLIYNRFITRASLPRLYAAASVIAAAMLAALQWAVAVDLPGAHLLLYAWKDVYMVVQVEIFYSFCASVFAIGTARWVYGFFGVIGSIGGLTGNLAVGPLAKSVGSMNSLWILVPMLLGGAAAAVWLGHHAAETQAPTTQHKPQISEAWAVVRKSRFLLLIMAVVALTQTAITLIDFSFNEAVVAAVPNTDERTQTIGQIYAFVSVGTFVLNALTGPILRIVGVPPTLLSIPLFLATAVVSFLVTPAFAFAAALKIASKCFDYTLFRSAKEILYIPLSHPEKTAGKSIVDMLTYRTAKGGASLLLLGLGALGLTSWVLGTTLVVIALWFAVTFILIRRFRQIVPRDEEMAGQTRGTP
ncbi:MAG: hypothetical protein KC502_12755 [Myxococcales bacterium]|nr:hypothetical protein [Myxococcales bacterium]